MVEVDRGGGWVKVGEAGVQTVLGIKEQHLTERWLLPGDRRWHRGDVGGAFALNKTGKTTNPDFGMYINLILLISCD